MSFHLVPPPVSNKQNKSKLSSNEKIPKKTTISTNIKIHGNPRPQLRTTKSSNSSVSSYSDHTPEIRNKNGAVNADELSKSLLGLKKSMSSLSLSHKSKKKSKNSESQGSYTPISPRNNRRSKHENAGTSSNGSSSPVLNRSNSSSLSNLKAAHSRSESPSMPQLLSNNQANTNIASARYMDLDYISRILDNSDLQRYSSHSRSVSADNGNKKKIDAIDFKPIIDLSIVNSYEKMKEHMVFPTFHVLKYRNFLSILSDHHQNDPISFASVRNHSLINFIASYKGGKQEPENLDDKQNDVTYYETLLGTELLRSRSIFRELIRRDSAKIENKSKIINCEELLQLNLSNYVRFVLDLPDEIPVPLEQLDSIQRTHYKYKELFKKIGHVLYLKNKEVGGDENPDSGNAYILQTIREVSYEYILLEKYLLHIFTKLGDNSLIQSRNLNVLFDKFNNKMQMKDSESIKVLHYNAYFSSQYSWYLSITAPFLRVVEMNSYSENFELVNNYDNYYKNFNDVKKVSFKNLDSDLYETYFKNLGLNDYLKYRLMTPEKLVALQKSIDTIAQKLKSYKKLESDDNISNCSHKPMNFEYYTESLATISSETFHLIQSRDLPLQLTLNNYSVILKEFHRILQKDGILEIPFIQLTRNKVKETFQQMHDFSKDEGFMNLNLLEQFNMIPDFLKTILAELSRIFGKGNVKYHVSLLNSIGELNCFLVKHICFQLFEMFGRLDEYCSKFTDVDDMSLRDINEEGMYYFIYIKAQKK
ncbi:uncharacterized protein AC631_05613 [Debaryomyces fabryi]|uniref:Uncharacterized protein n=1 Tax=Debaryomyces fabryi TaxID=58627 RepID=A0A0V1PQX6_9ASCO|nr:uncharacterized protein AC631_05613 [Debaryomyces fabryi]KRZ98627.1 hypothetical protein AC631_05613 [Debaryomyces fabryi]CUM50855.1 unnamed protein product [Debaryomyces fabryi]